MLFNLNRATGCQTRSTIDAVVVCHCEIYHLPPLSAASPGDGHSIRRAISRSVAYNVSAAHVLRFARAWDSPLCDPCFDFGNYEVFFSIANTMCKYNKTITISHKFRSAHARKFRRDLFGTSSERVRCHFSPTIGRLKSLTILPVPSLTLWQPNLIFCFEMRTHTLKTF